MKEELDLTKKEDVVKLMKTSKNSNEWNNNCDKVKAANGNNYPGFWYASIVLSGVMARVSSGWVSA